MKKWWLGSIGLALVVGGSAQAADLVYKATPYVPAFSWAGCYVGANAGGIWGRSDIGTSPSGAYLTPAGGAPPPNAAGTGLLAGDIALSTFSYRSENSGFEFGAQWGCNKQIGQFVFGYESDVQWSSLKHTIDATYAAITSANPAFTIAPHTDHVSARLDWFTTSRARFGVAHDRLLVFVTAGLAFAHFSADTSTVYGAGGALPVLANAQHVGSSSSSRFGGVAGGGIEWAFAPRWSMKAEYLAMAFPNWNYTVPLVAPAGVAAGYSWRTDITSWEHIVRVGLNYKIDWAGFLGN